MTVKKITSISPTIQPNKTNMRSFESFQNLDKRISNFVDQTIKEFFAQPGIFEEPIFVGYFINGGDVSVQANLANFRSPIDNHQYTQDEVLYYQWSPVSSRTAAADFVNGQTTRPNRANTNSGAGDIFRFDFDIDDSFIVHTLVSYFDGAEHVTTDGIMKVTAICRRKSQ